MNLSLPPIQCCAQSEALLSPAQESLWFIQQIDPQTVAYNSCYLFKLSGGVDRQTLEQALKELVLRHESLRAVYPGEEGQPRRVIRPVEPLTLAYVDFST